MSTLTKKQLTALAILAALNILFGNLATGDGQTLAGGVVEAHSPEMRGIILRTCLIGFQFFGFLIGALVAAIPFRKKPYTEKWVTFSLWISIGLQVAYLVAALIKLISTWL